MPPHIPSCIEIRPTNYYDDIRCGKVAEAAVLHCMSFHQITVRARIIMDQTALLCIIGI